MARSEAHKRGIDTEKIDKISFFGGIVWERLKIILKKICG